MGRWASVASLVSVLTLLTGCGCPADSTAVLSDSREPLATGTRLFSHAGPETVDFNLAAVRLRDDDSKRPRRYCGRNMVAEEGVTDAAIVADIGRQLGEGWRAAEEVPYANSKLKIYRWQSACSARFYALTIYSIVPPGPLRLSYRPMSSMYPCGSA